MDTVKLVVLGSPEIRRMVVGVNTVRNLGLPDLPPNDPPCSYATVKVSIRQPEPPPMTPALQKRIADATREISAATFGLTPSQAALLQSAPSLTFDHWRSIRVAMLREASLIAIWFVDSVSLYYLAAPHWPRPSGLGMWYPSLVVFDTATASASAWLLAPWFASFPGVWAEMSDGQHVLFVPKRSHDADS